MVCPILRMGNVVAQPDGAAAVEIAVDVLDAASLLAALRPTV